MAARPRVEVRGRECWRPGGTVALLDQDRDRDHRQHDDPNRPGPSARAPFTSRRDEREEEQDDRDEQRESDDDPVLSHRWDQREQREVPEEIPIRARIDVEIDWTCPPPQLRRPYDDRQDQHDSTDREREDDILPGCIGPERHAICLEELVVPPLIGDGVDRLPGFGGSEMPWRTTR